MSEMPSKGSSHHLRFYLVMTTLVIGGIFLVLLMNDNGSGLGITNMAIFNGKTDATDGSNTLVEDSKTTDKVSKFSEVEFSLTYDKVPQVNVNNNAKVEHIDVTFRDFNTKIYVNDNRLELSGLEEATLSLDGFEGDLFFNDAGVTAEGTARQVEVNGVRLSSVGKIAVSFKNLGYNAFDITEIELPNGLSFPKGSGELKVADKLTYELQQDQLNLGYFNGKVSSDQEGVKLEGVAKGIKVSGALLNFGLE